MPDAAALPRPGRGRLRHPADAIAAAPGVLLNRIAVLMPGVPGLRIAGLAVLAVGTRAVADRTRPSIAARLQSVADRTLERITRDPLRGAWRAVATVTITVTVASGALMRVTDPHAFPNIWKGMYWAVQTVTTVGYGDVVPTSAAGRALAALVMVVGIGFITVTTAAIASALVEAGRRRERREEDSPVDELRRLREEVHALAAEVHALREREPRPPEPPS